MDSKRVQQDFGVVYKYVTAERIDVLRNSSIRFTQPMVLNDPFEFLPGMGDFGKQILEAALVKGRKDCGDMGEAVAKVFGPGLLSGAHRALPKVLSEAFALLSLARSNSNIIMWSHYASQHTGFAIGFDSTSDFFSPGGNRAVDGLQEVAYSEHRQSLPAGGLSELSDDEFDLVNKGLLYTKSIGWSYEQELRIFAHPKEADRVVEVSDAPPILLYSFPVECVREVVLGARMADEVKAELVALIKDKYPTATVYLASLHESDYALQLTRVNLAEPFPPPGLPGANLKWGVSAT